MRYCACTGLLKMMRTPTCRGLWFSLTIASGFTCVCQSGKAVPFWQSLARSHLLRSIACDWAVHRPAAPSWQQVVAICCKGRPSKPSFDCALRLDHPEDTFVLCPDRLPLPLLRQQCQAEKPSCGTVTGLHGAFISVYGLKGILSCSEAATWNV